MKHLSQEIQASEIVRALLTEFGMLTEHRVLQDSLPGRLATLLRCRSVLLYQRVNETLQLAAGSFDDTPGWSAPLLAMAHINPISVRDDGPEARAWRERQPVLDPEELSTLIALPLIYRRRGIGVLVAIRGKDDPCTYHPPYWTSAEVQFIDIIADIVALMLENTRLLERDRARIHELSLLNNMSNQMNSALYDHERLKSIILQRTKEISLAEVCAFIEPSEPRPSWVTPTLYALLLHHFQEQRTPLLIERPGDRNNPRTAMYLQHLPDEVKTFFAFPVLDSHEPNRYENVPLDRGIDTTQNDMPAVLGIIIGMYHHVAKMHHDEIVLLEVLANQASAVLKNMYLLTSIQQLAEEKRRLDRLASLGELSANVAHEVRNPLASIKTTMQILASELAGSTNSDLQEGACESIGVVLQEVERLDTIVRELLQFAKPPKLHRSHCTITELSDHVLQLLQSQCSKANIIVQRIYSLVPPLWLDRAQIEQVLFNLYLNALQAMSEGGTLTIACHLISAEQAIHEMKTSTLPHDILPEKPVIYMPTYTCSAAEQLWLELAVSDTGSGITPDQAERIFQPFFTTKAHGIGLGLAISRRLIEDHGGYIRVEEQSGDGATISVRLPLISEREEIEGQGPHA